MYNLRQTLEMQPEEKLCVVKFKEQEKGAYITSDYPQRLLQDYECGQEAGECLLDEFVRFVQIRGKLPTIIEI